MSVAAIYELATPFTATDLPFLKHEQTADLFIITSLDHPIQRLRRFGHSNWIIDDAPIGAQIPPPTGVSVTVESPSSGSDFVPIVKYYIVTAINEAGQESTQSIGVNGVNDLSLRGNRNVISWAPRDDAVEYRVYEERSGVFGFLGSVAAGFNSFVDDNIQANFADGPPKATNPFASNNHPASVTFHESRAWYGRTLTMPNAIWASQSDDLFNFDRSTPVRATDSLAFRLRATKLNTIRHLVSLKDLMVMTSDMIFSIRSTGSGYLSPTSSKAVPEGFRGVGFARPVVVGDVGFYTSVAENSIHTLGFTFEKDGYRGNNISVFASHFFDQFRALQLAWTDAPANVLWVRREDGKLAALTWMEEQDVWGWTLCETDGVVESICSVPEERRDVLYAVIRRTVQGEQRRYVECLADTPWIRQGWSNMAEAVVMDCAAVVESEDKFSNVTRLNWLEGREVICLADGVVIRDRQIVGGELVPPLPDPVNRLVVGLAFTARIRTLRLAGQGRNGDSMIGRRASISSVTISVQNTGGMGAGLVVGANLKDGDRPRYAAPLPYGIPTQVPADPFTGFLETDGVEAGDWTDAAVEVWQTDPLPLVLLGVYPDAEIGR